MVCRTPAVDKSLAVILPFDLDVSFIMDGLQLTPVEDSLTIVADPVYYAFDDPVLQINSSTTIQFQASTREKSTVTTPGMYTCCLGRASRFVAFARSNQRAHRSHQQCLHSSESYGDLSHVYPVEVGGEELPKQ